MFWTKCKPSVPMARPRNCRARRATLWLEELERRDAPATLVDPMTLTYQDVVGERVRVHISRPLFQAATINNVFTFATGSVNGDNTIPQQLQTIDLTQLAAQGVSLSITANRHGGDGHADVGFINAAGFDLGEVTVQGDLGRIDAGGLSGLESLSVDSLGQGPPSPDGKFSFIQGSLGLLQVGGDVAGASVLVADAPGGAAGTIGLVRLGGSLIGGATGQSGVIESAGSIGRVDIEHDVRGGAGFHSGVVQSGTVFFRKGAVGAGFGSGVVQRGTGIGEVSIGGSLIGGRGGSSGQIVSGQPGAGGPPAVPVLGGPAVPGGSAPVDDGDHCGLGVVTIEGDVRGGEGFQSGAVINNTLGPIDRVRVGGSVLGGLGFQSAQIFSGGDIGPVKIEGDVRGGDTPPGGGIGGASPLVPVGILQSGSGSVVSLGSIARVTIEGSLIGGAADQSGQIVAMDLPIQGVTPSGPGSLGPVTIEGDIRGGAGGGSGAVIGGGRLARVKVGGSLLGGEGKQSGQIAGGVLDAVDIEHDVMGGAGGQSGTVVGSSIDEVTVDGSLLRGHGPGSGSLQSTGPMGPVVISGDVSGSVTSRAALDSLHIGGSLLGRISSTGPMGAVVIQKDVNEGSISSGAALDSLYIGGSLLGGAFNGSGRVGSFGPMGPVVIKGDVRGGAGIGSGVLSSATRIDEVTVGGSLVGGAGASTGQIATVANGSLGTVEIKHDLRGGAGFQSGAILGATELAALSVGGSVQSGSGNQSGSIVAGHLGATKVRGSLVGTSTNPVLISAPGGLRIVKVTVFRAVAEQIVTQIAARKPLPGCRFVIVVVEQQQTVTRMVPEERQITIQNEAKLDRLTVGGRVEFANMVAGPGGQIGTIKVEGNWIASNVAAGVDPGPDGFFGTADDTLLPGAPGQINRIVIEGQVFGTPTAANLAGHYGFVAREVKALTVHGFSFPLTPGPGNDDLLVGTTGNVRLREV